MIFNFKSLGLVLFLTTAIAFQANVHAEEISPDDLSFSGPAPAQLGETYEFNTYQRRKDYPERSVYFWAKSGSNTFNSELPQISSVTAPNRFTRTDSIAKTTINSNFTLGYNHAPNANSYYKAEINFMRLTVPPDYSGAAGLLKLWSSTTDLWNLRLSASAKCWSWDNMNQFCLGYQLVYDSMPAIPFQKTHTANTMITITNLKDIELGAHMTYNKEFESGIKLSSSFLFDYGMGAGQATNITTSGSQVMTLLLTGSYPMGDFDITAGIDASLATIPVSNTIEKWKVKNENYSALVGVAWGF